ncbi:MAG: hypothetical protein CM1200mP30_15690 [Pseudomonadota bacterium]|nr:MAG: hypothetical protein CM1200mP30_15690 [Pseudomonadota bacterium]
MDAGTGKWGEVTSTSNCTDTSQTDEHTFQGFRDRKNRFVHMLNGTAIAVSRTLIALENGQQKDGHQTSVLFKSS